MQKLSDLLFVSSNTHKFKEVQEILGSFGIPIEFFKLNLQEIQSDWLDSISSRFENRLNVDIGSFGTSLILSVTFLIGLLFSGIGWLKYKANGHDSDDHLRSDEYEEGYWDRK